MAMSKSNHEMPKCEANHGPLTPITYLVWAASVYGDRTSIIYGDIKFTWAETLERCRRLACKISQLAAVGDTVRLTRGYGPGRIFQGDFRFWVLGLRVSEF